MYLNVYDEKVLADTYVKEGKARLVMFCPCCLTALSLESVFSLAALETQLVAYVKDATAAEKPFDVSIVPKISRAQAAADAARKSSPCHRASSLTVLVRTDHVGHYWCPGAKENCRCTPSTISGRTAISIHTTVVPSTGVCVIWLCI
jgi:hypothetical protein